MKSAFDDMRNSGYSRGFMLGYLGEAARVFTTGLFDVKYLAEAFHVFPGVMEEYVNMDACRRAKFYIPASAKRRKRRK